MNWSMPKAEIAVFLLILAVTFVALLKQKKNQQTGDMILTTLAAILVCLIICVGSNYFAFQAGRGNIAEDKSLKSLAVGGVYKCLGAVSIENKNIAILKDRQGAITVYQFKGNPPSMFVKTNDKEYLPVAINDLKYLSIPVIKPDKDDPLGDDPLIEF